MMTDVNVFGTFNLDIFLSGNGERKEVDIHI